MSTRIFLVGAGSGGHVYPLVAVARELERQSAQSGIKVDIVLMGDSKGFIKKAAEELGRGYIGITTGKWRRYASIDNFVDILKIPIGVLQSLFFLWFYMPDIVFSKVGYDSVPAVIAARILFIPIVIHESDSIPGVSNMWASKFAIKIFTAFDLAVSYFDKNKTEVVGNPIRQSVLNGDRAEALTYFRFNEERPVVLFMGGSQGAGIINEELLLSLVQITRKYQVLHKCGEGNFKHVLAEAESMIKEGQGAYGQEIEKNYRVYPFFNEKEMGLAYAVADIIVSRAGAGSIFEIASLGKPAIIVPLKGSASEHQFANASEVAKFGATVVEESNLTTNILLGDIETALANKNNTAENLKDFAKPDAAVRIAKTILEMV